MTIWIVDVPSTLQDYDVCTRNENEKQKADFCLYIFKALQINAAS